MGLATLVVSAVCGLIAIALGIRFVGRPVRAIAEQAHRIGAGDFTRRLDISQDDEIGELSREMNRLCDRLVAARDEVASATEARIAALEHLRHADRLATVGQLASGVAHELGTPLSIVAARAGLLKGGGAPAAEVAESGAVIAEQAARMTAIIRQLLDLSRRRGPQPGVVDVRAVVGRTATLLSSLARGGDVAVDVVTPSSPLLAEIDENQMQQALAHVVVNAIQATPKGRHVTIGMRAVRARPPAERGAGEGDYVCITVADEGGGIDPEHLPRVFEPFFTTKSPGEGTGLGLSVADGIVADHKGWMAVASVPGQGSRFDVYLPLAAAAQQRASA
jgi:signal transduction histidine kinase